MGRPNTTRNPWESERVSGHAGPQLGAVMEGCSCPRTTGIFHSASVGRRYTYPSGSRFDARSRAVSIEQKFCASIQLTVSTIRIKVPCSDREPAIHQEQFGAIRYESEDIPRIGFREFERMLESLILPVPTRRGVPGLRRRYRRGWRGYGRRFREESRRNVGEVGARSP
jgi:hypothetical protein